VDACAAFCGGVRYAKYLADIPCRHCRFGRRGNLDGFRGGSFGRWFSHRSRFAMDPWSGLRTHDRRWRARAHPALSDPALHDCHRPLGDYRDNRARSDIVDPHALHGHPFPACGISGGRRRGVGLRRRHIDRQFVTVIVPLRVVRVLSTNTPPFRAGPTMFTLAHLSDPHLAPLPTPQWKELLGKRLTGYINWQKKRRFIHDAEKLAAIVADIKAQKPDHIAVTGDIANIALAAEFRQGRDWLEGLGPAKNVSLVPGNHDIYVSEAAAFAARQWGAYMNDDENVGGFPYLRRRGNVA